MTGCCRRPPLAGVDVSAVLRGGRTGRYVAVLDADGDLVAGIADMAATDDLGPEVLDHDLIRSAALVVVDGNLPATTIDAVLALGVRVVIDPVSVAKARRISPLLSRIRPVYALTPNEDELAALGSVDELHDRGVEVVWVRRGAAGSLLSTPGGAVQLDAPAVVPVDVTGAGDAMLAAFCHHLLAGRARRGRRARGPRGRGPHRRQPAHRPPGPAREDDAVTHPGLQLTDEVAEALASGTPVVALESTIISHGMPYPQNVAMATEVEGIVREHGAVPATIAVLGGTPRIGLNGGDLELLASDPDVVKVSVRDLPSVIARGGHGATTVAATMRLASLAGIRVFVTGGLGGVHRGAETTFDISADLTELSTTPVCVVSAGVKSILDIGLTLENLETLGVPVLVDGSDEFPSFYSRSSGFAGAAARRRPGRDRAHHARGLVARPDQRDRGRAPDPRGRRDPGRRDRRRHQPGPRRPRRARHRRPRRHAVPPRPHRRAHRRGQPDRQHRAGPRERARGCRRSRCGTPPCRVRADGATAPASP